MSTSIQECIKKHIRIYGSDIFDFPIKYEKYILNTPLDIKKPIVLMLNKFGDVQICEWVKFYTHRTHMHLGQTYPLSTNEYKNLLWIGFRPVEYLEL